MKMPPVEVDVFPASGRTDGQDEADGSFSPLCVRA
jgi:hypothetical protein